MVVRLIPKLKVVLLLVCLLVASFNPIALANQQADSSAIIPVGLQTNVNQVTLPPGFQIISTTSNSLLVEIQTTPFTLDTMTYEGQPCQSLKAGGYYPSGSPGKPAILSAGVMLGVQLDTTPTYTVLSMEIVDLPGKNHLCPVATPIIQRDLDGLLGNQGEVFTEDATIYSRDAFYPPQPIELVVSGMIRSQRVARLSFSPFQYNPVTEVTRVVQHVNVEIQLGKNNILGTDKALLDEGAFEPVLQKTLINYDQARYWRLLPQQTPSVIAKPIPSKFMDEPAYKIQVDRDGIYQGTYSELQLAGVPVEGLDPRTLRLYNQEIEIPIYIFGEEDGIFNTTDYLLFYGQKIDTKFTSINIYWLNWGNGNGLRMSTQDGTVQSASIPVSYKTTLHLEEDIQYYSDSPSGPQFDHWYWYLLNAYNGPVSHNFTFSLQNLDATSTTATLTGLLKGYYADLHHHTLILLNGNPIDDHTWPTESEYAFSFDIPASYLVEGINTITITCPFDGGMSYDYQLVNWFDIEYDHTYTAENDQLYFTKPNLWQFQVGGYINSTLGVFEVTNPLAPVRILGGEVIPDGSLYQMNFEQDFSGNHSYLVISPSRWLHPLAITEDIPSSLKDPANAADYIIITHADFLNTIQPLAAYRASQGFRVRVVDVQDIYDEFNGGVFDPQAIQSFLSYAYLHWAAPVPVFVLLVGDGHMDFKNNYGNSGSFYIPPYLGEFDPWIGETASDNRYVTVRGDDILPDMYIGRLPVNSVAETSAMVTKILSYDQAPLQGDWNTHLTFVADNADLGGNFPVHSDLIADHLSSGYTAEKIYYGLPPYQNAADAQAAIINAINQGRLIVHFTGHASIPDWASEKLISVTSIDSLTNTDNYPLFLPMTCQEGYFIRPTVPSLAESLVRASEKGAIGSFSPAGFGLANGHDILAQGIYQAFFNDGTTQFGAATTFAKYYLAANGPGFGDLIDTYNLFGDPASQLKISPTDVTVSFSAKALPGTIQLSWETVNELWMVGFNLYRSESLGGGRQIINPDLILAQKPGQMDGALYQYDDIVEPGSNYYYWIELNQVYGRNLIGPISILSPYWISLPVIVR